jgi:hypothetical protein
MLVSSALAAVAAMAFIGTAPALAEGSTAACVVNETPCSPENIYTGQIKGSAEEVVLLTEIINITCEESVAWGTVLGLGNPLEVHAEELAFLNCNNGCTVGMLSGGLIEVLRTAENLGFGRSTGEIEELVRCIGIIHCVYGGEPELHLEGGENPELLANGSLLQDTGGLLCPEEAVMHATYRLDEPSTLYLSS